MKILKRTGLGIAVAFVIILVGVVYITTVLNPNDYIDEITQTAKKEADIDLSIGGVDWSWASFPQLTVELEDISVTQPDAVKRIKLKHLQLQLEIVPLLQENATIEARIFIDKVNIDDYSPPAGGNNEETPKPNGQEITDATAPLIPMDVIKPLNINANLRIGELIAKTITVKEITVYINARDGIVELSDFSGDTLGGNFILNGALDVNGTEPVITVDNQLNALQLAPLVKTFADSDVFSGIVDFNGNITTKGNTTDELIANLNGLNELAITEGLIKGANITQLAFDKLGALGALAEVFLTEEDKQKVPPAFRKDSTIDNLTALVALENGIARTKQLSADLEEATADGSAEVDLINETLAMDLNVKLSEAISNPHIAKLSWPVRCKGDLAATPNCSVETKGVRRELEILAKGAVDAKLTEEEERLRKRLREKEDEAKRKVEEKLKDKLQNLFR